MRREPFTKVHLKALFRDFGGRLLQVRQGVANYDAKHLEQNAPKERKVAKATFAKGSGILALLMLAILPVFADTSLEEFIQTLKEKLPAIQTYRGDFTQIRHLAMLDLDLTFQGTLLYETATGNLLWRVKSPLPGAFRIYQGKLAQWDAVSQKSIQIATEKLPWLKLLQGQLGDWLAGNLENLQKYADLEKIGDRQVRLTPKEGILPKVATAMELHFSEDLTRVEKAVLHEKNGDTLTIHFLPPTLNNPIPPKDWKF